MDNKEIKKNAAELNDEALENVSGGLLKPIILTDDDSWSIYCIVCQKREIVHVDTYNTLKANGGYCCDACKAKMAENNL